MKKSRLVAIVTRLEAMTEATDTAIQSRRFELEGDEKCTVSYDATTEMFELVETGTKQVYQFDNLDMVAIEIFELLQEA
ncbi:YkuJ family protein [Vagococcus coleopterorum]|uniref:YkuJ family protein n=1 Tax=Vagococcus coleopterorum TaxID=2714946 RepID=A0A6G8AKK9_9ENTE|nr:YkuJ family protein [Vagococcus coleopterorum]QIL45624.1 YkuJ family protein [Vagococcus coleopterorum]